jgi:hypothetical protein
MMFNNRVFYFRQHLHNWREVFEEKERRYEKNKQEQTVVVEYGICGCLEFSNFIFLPQSTLNEKKPNKIKIQITWKKD